MVFKSNDGSRESGWGWVLLQEQEHKGRGKTLVSIRDKARSLRIRDVGIQGSWWEGGKLESRILGVKKKVKSSGGVMIRAWRSQEGTICSYKPPG